MSKKMKLSKEDKETPYNKLPYEVREHLGRILAPCDVFRLCLTDARCFVLPSQLNTVNDNRFCFSNFYLFNFLNVFWFFSHLIGNTIDDCCFPNFKKPCYGNPRVMKFLPQRSTQSKLDLKICYLYNRLH